MKNKIYKKVFIFLVLTLILLICCQKGQVNSKSDLEPNVIAMVNGEIIDVESFRKEFKMTSRKYRVKNNDDYSKNEILFLKLKSLNEIIQNVLFRQEAKKYKVSLDLNQFQATMGNIKTDYLDESFIKTFKLQNINKLEWENRLRNSLILKSLLNKIIDSKVTVDGDSTKEYFDEHPEEFQKGEQVKALHINVATEEEARKLLKKIKTRKSKFTELAIKHSLGPESVEGGNLGYFEAGQMPAEFDGVFNLKLYETSNVIQTPYGFHILKVVGKKQARKMNFQEAEKVIRKKLIRKKQEEAFNRWITDIKKKAVIKINFKTIETVK